METPPGYPQKPSQNVTEEQSWLARLLKVTTILCGVLSMDLCYRRRCPTPDCKRCEPMLSDAQKERIMIELTNEASFFTKIVTQIFVGVEYPYQNHFKDLMSILTKDPLMRFHQLPAEMIDKTLCFVFETEYLFEDVDTMLRLLPPNFVYPDGLNERKLPHLLPIVVRNWTKFTEVSKLCLASVVLDADPANFHLGQLSEDKQRQYFYDLANILAAPIQIDGAVVQVRQLLHTADYTRFHQLVAAYPELQQILQERFPVEEPANPTVTTATNDGEEVRTQTS